MFCCRFDLDRALHAVTASDLALLMLRRMMKCVKLSCGGLLSYGSSPFVLAMSCWRNPRVFLFYWHLVLLFFCFVVFHVELCLFPKLYVCVRLFRAP